MAKQPTVTVVTSGNYDSATLNTNFSNIQAHFDNLISRLGDTPNTMAGDLDMNSNDIINVGDMDVATLTINGIDVTNVISNPLDGLVPSEGDILYYTGGAWTLLSPGTDGQVLKLSGGVPTWAADTDTDTVGVTVEEDDSSVQTNVTIINFVTGGQGIVSSPTAGEVEVDLDAWTV